MGGSHRICAILFACSFGFAFAQQDAIPIDSTPSAVRTPQLAEPLSSVSAGNGGRIQLDVVVTDKSGAPVHGLKREDFSLLDDSQPAKILSFQAFDREAQKPERPVEVYLVLDAVTVGFKSVYLERQEIDKFLRANGGHLPQPVSILLLTSDAATVVAGPSTDGNTMASALSRVDGTLRQREQIGIDSSSIYSIYKMAWMNESNTTKPARKLMIWFGRDWPMPAMVDPDVHQEEIFKDIVEYSTRLREAHLTVYSLMLGDFDSQWYRAYFKGVKSAKKVEYRDLSLPVVALQSGGLVLSPSYELAKLIDTCMADAAAYYTLSFDPPATEHANQYHDLKVQIGRPGLTARTNSGYYNQPDLAPNNRSGSEPPPSLKTPQEKQEALARPVTVAQLEEVLTSAEHLPDGEAAHRISKLVLTQRVSSVRLSALKARLPGAKAQQALAAIGDASAFLMLPPDEILGLAPPSLTEQRSMLARTVDYLKKTMPQLPNLFATRTTALYQAEPQATLAALDGQPWRQEANLSATVLYRDGKEVVDSEKAKARASSAKANGLITRGTFGPILSAVVTDAARGQLVWNHWEQAAAGPQAVFSFVVPIAKSSYEVEYHDPSDTAKEKSLQQRTAYHGQMAIDPATGTILRFQMEADLDGSIPLVRADIAVEYGPVEIGGKTYICPVRGVSISRAKVDFRSDLTRMSDMAFREYHAFRAESRVLAGEGDPLTHPPATLPLPR